MRRTIHCTLAEQWREHSSRLITFSWFQDGHLVRDHDWHASVGPENCAHGVDAFYVSCQQLGTTAVGDVDAFANHKRP